MKNLFKKLFRKNKTKADELIEELDEICNELNNSETVINKVDIIMKNQVELAKELINERNGDMKNARS